MLQSIRDYASGWFAYAIIILISVPFALWGLNHYFDGGGKQAVAEVGGTPISTRAFAQAFREQQMRLEQMFGGKLPAGVDSKTIKQMVLRGLVREAVFRKAANDAGYQVTDKELIEQLMQYPVFQVNGKFSKDRYLQVLKAQGMSPDQFEGRVRRALAIQQMQNGIQQTAFATPAQAAELLSLRDEKRKLSMVLIPRARFAATAKVDSQAVKAFYDKHKADYMTAEKVRLAYLQLSRAELEKGIKATPTELRSFYQTHRSQFVQPARARAREIVVDLGKGRASARLKSIAAGLSKGESFADLAKRFSQAGNAKQGGLLGEVSRGDLPHELANALFALKPGQVTPPIKVGEKVYRLKLEGLQAAVTPAFAKLHDQVKTAYVKAKVERQFNDEAQRLATLSYQNPGSLAPVAKALGLKVKTTGWLTRSGGSRGLSANPKVLAAAFSKSVLNNGANSQVLKIGKQDEVLLRVLERKTPAQKPLAEVQADIHAVLIQRAAEKAAAQMGKKLIAAVHSGKTLATGARADKLVPRELGWVSRQAGAHLPAAVVAAAFQQPAPTKDKPSVAGVALRNGDYAVFEIQGVQRPKPAAKAVVQAQKQLDSLSGRIELQVVYQSLEHADGVKVYPHNLNF